MITRPSESLDSTLKDPAAFRVLVAAGIVLFLLGSLLPSIGGVSVSVISAPMVALPVLFAGIGPRKSPRAVILVAAALFATLALFAHFGPPPLGEYGAEKQLRLVTSTFLSALCAASIFSYDRLRTLARTWVLVTTTLAILTLFSGESFSMGRASVFDNNPIWLARAFGAGALFAISLPTLGANRWWRAAAIPLLIGLVLTGSRGPAVGLTVALALLLVRDTVRLVGTLITASMIYAAFTWVPTLSSTRIGHAIADPETGGGTRTKMWASAWDVWRTHPSGVGIGNWSYYTDVRGFSWPHNLWLEVAAELGTLSIIALLLVVLLTIRGLTRQIGTSNFHRLVLALFASEAVAVSLSGDLSARTFFFLLFLGVHMIFLTRPVSARPTGKSPAPPVVGDRHNSSSFLSRHELSPG